MSARDLRIVFGGTPAFAAGHLEALIREGFKICGVYTQPDRPSGRGRRLTASPVKALALEHGLPVYQPENFRDQQDIDTLADLRPDIFVVVAYGIILPQAVLDIPVHGCINVHGSLLPRLRGAAPVQRALLNGDPETGVTIMQMNRGLDTGDILLTRTVPIGSDDTSEDLFQHLLPAGCAALLETLDLIAAGAAVPVPQDSALATYAEKITREESLLNFAEPAELLHRKIRGYIPWPVASFTVDGSLVKIRRARVLRDPVTAEPGTVLKAGKEGISVATGSGILLLEILQLPGKQPADAASVLNGHRDMFAPGKRLS